jgi:uncharacterized protein
LTEEVHEVIDGYPVIDAVVHAYNFAPSNYASRSGVQVAAAVYGSVLAYARQGMVPEEHGFLRDWSMEETANMLFLESDVDIAVHHCLPLFAFKDGGCSFEKTLEAKERWPSRFITYAGVDPLQGKKAIEELERQVEALDPVGLKLYPNSWVGDEVIGWRMDDPEIAFPVFQRAQELGLKVVAIHKAVPLGPLPLDPYRIDDVDRAAIAFPGLTFEVVHGGMAFLEESAWQLARFENVYVNLEITSSLLGRRPLAFGKAMATLLQYGGEMAMSKILWGTGAMGFHPRPLLETFVRDFEFPEEIVDKAGIPQMTPENKRRVLAENYASMIGMDLPARLGDIADDHFAQCRDTNGGNLFEPFSTTAVADRDS